MTRRGFALETEGSLWMTSYAESGDVLDKQENWRRRRRGYEKTPDGMRRVFVFA